MTVYFDIKVNGKNWTRKAEVRDMAGAQQLAAHTEELFRVCRIPAKVKVHP